MILIRAFRNLTLTKPYKYPSIGIGSDDIDMFEFEKTSTTDCAKQYDFSTAIVWSLEAYAETERSEHLQL